MACIRRSLFVVLCVFLAGASLVSPVGAALASQGPNDPGLGVPSFFADASGMRLSPCVAGAPLCSATRASFADASGAPGTGSLFYFSATASLVTQPAPGVAAVNSAVSMSLQATRTGPTTFQRLRFQVQVPQPGTYTVTFPYGSQQFTVATISPTGRDIDVTTDSSALGGPIGPFLQWAGAPAPPAAFLGDNATPHAVVGSPSNRNFVRVQGTGINPNPADAATSCPAAIAGADCVQTTLFVLQGQLADSLIASPTSVVFPSQAVGTTSATQTVTVTNNGTRPFAVNAASANAPFAVDPAADTCSAATVAPGSTCTVGVSYAPTSNAAATGSLTIDSNDPASPLTVGLSASAPAPGVTLSTGNVAFGNQPTGTTSGAQTITVSSTGAAPLHVSAVAVGGANPADFPQTNTCAGATVNPGASCAIRVTFTPAANGVRSASMTITDDAAGSPRSVALSGTGTAAASAVGLNPTSLTYASQTVGTSSAPQTVTVTNTGNASLTVSAVALSGTNPGDYRQTNNCVGATVAPRGTCSASVVFSPAAPGSRNAALTFTDNAPGSPHSVSLAGTATAAPPAAPAASVSPGSLQFANQTQQTASSPQAVTLTNTGNAPLTVSAVNVAGANAADFTQTNTCLGRSIAAGTSCRADVTFRPAAAGSRTASITFTDNALGSPHAAALSGTGIVMSVQISTTRLSFGSQRTGTSSPLQTVRVTNNGGGSVIFGSVTMGGTNASDFALNGNSCSGATIVPGSSCTVDVVFVPAATGAKAASVTFSDNVPGSPQVVALDGTGVAPLIATNPTSVDFGPQFLLATAVRTVTVSNTGSAPLIMGGIGVSGVNSADFTIVGNSCTAGIAVAPGAACSITLSFHPGFIGRRTATLRILSDAANGLMTVPLAGTGSLLPF